MVLSWLGNRQTSGSPTHDKERKKERKKEREKERKRERERKRKRERRKKKIHIGLLTKKIQREVLHQTSTSTEVKGCLLAWSGKKRLMVWSLLINSLRWVAILLSLLPSSSFPLHNHIHPLTTQSPSLPSQFFLSTHMMNGNQASAKIKSSR